MEGDMETSVLERLEKLERQNRRFKRAGLVVMLLAGATLLIGQAKSQWKAEAEMFILKDAEGKVRAELGMAVHGPHLAFYDAAGTRRAVLGIVQKGPGLFFLDTTQKRRVAIGVVEKGPVLLLFDEDGNTVFSKP
jgi:hypothetical protein